MGRGCRWTLRSRQLEQWARSTIAMQRPITMRVPLSLAVLAPVEHGAYARVAGQRVGGVDRCMPTPARGTRHAGNL